MALLGVVVLAFFFDLLFFPGERVLSKEGTDVWRQFAITAERDESWTGCIDYRDLQ